MEITKSIKIAVLISQKAKTVYTLVTRMIVVLLSKRQKTIQVNQILMVAIIAPTHATKASTIDK
ncbi:hypothetical protein [Oceanobacillus bengalensis]|uniref:hypothetical protein n=1 Tax=Oceanobacillus bengalensis TaxID=1435466 RepID=UPI0036D438BF